jgi:hypothetical protein
MPGECYSNVSVAKKLRWLQFGSTILLVSPEFLDMF